LTGNRKFDVTLSDEAIDLTKARRIEAHAPSPHVLLGRPQQLGNGGQEQARGRERNPSLS
jgi:hypothetical protein